MPPTPLFVTRKFPPSVGGMQTLAAAVWRSLLRVTPDAHLVAHSGSNGRVPLWLPGALVRVIWLFGRRRVSVVLAGDLLMYILIYPFVRLFRVRSATFVHGLDITYRNPLYRAVAYRVLRRAPFVLANSAATAEVAKSIGVSPERISVVRLCVAAPPVAAGDRTAARSELLGRLGLSPDVVLLLTLGRLVPRKGSRWFVESVLPALPDRVVYLIAGDGPERDRIASAARRAGVSDRVRILGLVDEADRELLMRGVDIFIQPNVRVPGDMEGFGLVIIETALRGTPTVASALEGILDAVVNNVTGVLLPPETPPEWVARLSDLIGSPDDLVAMGTRFQAEVRSRFSEEQMSRQLEADLGLRPTDPVTSTSG
jgi:glycosyltransferase involved in cell wall biosynthesis